MRSSEALMSHVAIVLIVRTLSVTCKSLLCRRSKESTPYHFLSFSRQRFCRCSNKSRLVEPESLKLDLRGHVRDLLLPIILRGPWWFTDSREIEFNYSL